MSGAELLRDSILSCNIPQPLFPKSLYTRPSQTSITLPSYSRHIKTNSWPFQKQLGSGVDVVLWLTTDCLGHWHLRFRSIGFHISKGKGRPFRLKSWGLVQNCLQNCRMVSMIGNSGLMWTPLFRLSPEMAKIYKGVSWNLSKIQVLKFSISNTALLWCPALVSYY